VRHSALNAARLEFDLGEDHHPPDLYTRVYFRVRQRRPRSSSLCETNSRRKVRDARRSLSASSRLCGALISAPMTASASCRSIRSKIVTHAQKCVSG
jgi:hypothetical protein